MRWSPRSIGWGRAALYRRAISTPQPNPLENTTRVHRRVEAARLGELQVENRGDRNEGEREGPDALGAQNLAGEEDVDGKARTLVAPEHEGAHERRNQEIDKPVPRAVAAEVEPVAPERKGCHVDDRTDQQSDGEEPEAGRPGDWLAVGNCRGGMRIGRWHVFSRSAATAA